MRTQLRWTITAAALMLMAGTAAQAADSGKPKLISNSQKYRVSGAQPATGRSGSAVLSARALLNKDNSADIEVTTGTFDNAAPGNISKIQYKPLDKNGKPILVVNWNSLSGGGYFRQTVNGLGRNQQMQIQGNVRGIDGARTDVVTVNGSAKLRPDVQVSDIEPASGLVNVPLNITAVVRELNNDTGANGDCMLYINQVLADHASAIWVDAGGTVSCMFTHKFTAAGNYDLKVAVENVVPADYDTTNNSTTATINITSPDNLEYFADANDQAFSDTTQSGFTEYHGSQMIILNNEQDSQNGWTQHSDIGFDHATPLTFPISASITESSDGSSASLTGNFPNVDADWSFSFQCGAATCSQAQAARTDNGFLFFVFTWSTTDSIAGISGGFSGQVSRDAGDVTFISTQAYCQWFDASSAPCPDNTQVYTTNNEQVSGTRLAFGSQDMLQFAMTDAGGNRYTANPIIPLAPYSSQQQQPYTCSDFVSSFDPTFYGTMCSGYSNTSTGKQGSVSSPQQ